MELDSLKSRLHKRLFSSDSDITLNLNIEDEMASLDKRIKRRKLYGTITLSVCSIGLALFAYFAYLIGFPMTSVIGIAVCIATVLAGLVALHATQSVRSDPTLTVSESLRSQLQKVRREIAFFRRFPLYFLIAITIGGALIVVGIVASLTHIESPVVLMNSLVPFVIAAACMHLEIRNCRKHVEDRLLPLQSKLCEDIEAISL